MDDFVESGMIDNASVDVKKTLSEEAFGAAGEIEKVRTYDLNITYDKYYQVIFQRNFFKWKNCNYFFILDTTFVAFRIR